MHLSTGLTNFKTGVIAICLLYTTGLWGQTQKSDWSLDTNAPLRLDKNKRANHYDIFTLENLATIEFSKETNSIWLPTPEGDLKEYHIDYTPVADPSVAHLYTIKTYRGHLKDDPSTLVAFDISEQGISAAVLNETQSYFIEPLQSESNQYIVYYKKNALVPSHKCAMHDAAEVDNKKENPLRVLTPDQKYTFKLAITASGEYSQQFGGSPVNTTMVLNAIASGVNMLNVIYLRDLGYELSLVTNQALIFTDPATDPFDISNPFFLGDEAHEVIANTLPASDYDIGHLVLWEDLGGIAAIRSVCDDLRKGNAYSSSITSASNLWIDYVAHELGHQFGAQHTFSADECGNSVDGHRFEPGEGSSIMSYAGTCGPPVSYVNQVDPFFHHASILEIHSNTISAQATCAVGDPTGNAFDPIVEAGNNITIPRSTPFILAGTATDANDTITNLTYSWEQADGDSPVTTGLPNCAMTEALFRFRPPSALPYRSFPEESEVLAGNNNGVDFEKLPCDSIDLTFSLTVRDNNINFGRVDFDQMFLSVVNTGPFNVVMPNGGETLFAGRPNLITWGVNNTDDHCPLVDVLLSVDSGMTFRVIADAIANDGTELIIIPDTLVSTARILISCDAPGGFGSASTFYDISDDEFKIATQPLVDNDGDNFDVTIDCDDNNPNVFPGATEICNGIDDNCSGLIDDNDPLITGQTTYYIDADGDGFGDASSSTLSCAPVVGFVLDNTDCDDTDPAVNPGATEICNGIDDNCNNLIDGNDPTLSGGITTWYIDLDGDGYGDPQMSQQACIQPMGYVTDGSDCNDNNAAIHPGAAEICNNIDDDCDGLIDDNDPDLQANNIWYLDSDGDTYGGSISLVACTQPSGYVTNNLDCNDNDPAINPNGTEICNGVDDDCDGLVDGADPNVTGTTTWYADTDGDGFGNPSIPQLSCTRPTGFVSNNTDCDDNFSSINPGAIEICNGVDDDCDGLIDTDDPSLAGTTIWYPDFDGDGFGNSQGAINSCTPPAGYIQVGGDCNDSNASINPNANEICNGNDDNCNGLTDDDDPGLIGATNWYADADLDGFGNPNVVIQSCTQPSGFVSNNVDCDDNNQNVSPSSLEICNGIDDDCDGLVDDDDPGLSGGNTWYLDNDQDGFGNLSNSIIACNAPFGYVSNNLDCNDNDSNISPSSQETCNGIDDDCDGLIDSDDPDLQGIINWFADFDADGFGNALVVLQACNQPQGYVPNDLDCNDNNPLINPTAVEICNGLDDDCDGLIDDADFNVQGLSTWYQDADNDGYGNIAVALQSCFQPNGYVPNSIDCNDNNAAVNPAAGEICDNGLDDDCDGLVDGADPDVIMGSTIWYIDNDGDGFGSGLNSTASCNQPVGFVGNNSDCNDNNPNVNPGATELCGNNIDDDCDGLIDDNDPDVQAMSSTWFLDGDNDGFGDPNNSILACVRPQGYTANNQDCDDNNATVNPNASEICDNGIDDDCDGLVDIDDPNVIAQQWYADNDGDGYGNLTEVITDCTPPNGFVGNSSDCDDTNSNVNPDATEVCDNGIDDDCDGLIDDDDPSVGGSVWYEDSDGDGFGNAQVTSTGCTPPAGFIAQDGDCNDNNAQVFPGQIEICDNNIDDDCDGLVDGADPDAAAASTWYQDSDNDGFGDASNSLQACTQPMGYVQDNTDCDDTNPAINPDGIEVCNGRDDDCNGLVDIDDPNLSGVGIWFADLDEDGFGDINNTILECSQPDGYLPNNEDCDDTDPNINPDAEEICNGFDDNCDGLIDDEDPQATGTNAIWYPDEDGDGFGDENAINLIEDCEQPAGYVSNNVDCDDTNAEINPDAIEIPSNGIDEDCDGQDATTAIDEVALPEVQLYPNPTLDYIHITSSTLELVDLTLYNLDGQKIVEDTHVTLSHRMDLRTVPSGTYFIKIDYLNTGQSTVRKVVKLGF